MIIESKTKAAISKLATNQNRSFTAYITRLVEGDVRKAQSEGGM